MRIGKRDGERRKRQDGLRWGRSLVTTGVMIVLIVAASIGVTRHISHMEEERCFQRLYEEADDLADSLEIYAANDREELELLSAVISQYQDFSSPELWRLLDSYTNIGMMSRVELLLPGDVVITRGGRVVDAGGLLSFEQEASKGAHITDRETDVLQPEDYVVRHYVTIRQGGETVALLYGVIELGALPETVSLDPYGGRGAMYIIEGKTGDFLVDTWHPGKPGNMWQMGGREMAPGYNSEELEQGVANGDSRYVVFVSATLGEYLYFYYQPMAINNWRIAVSVPESVVFESANTINLILNIFLAFELACFVVYLLWMMRYTRRVTDEKQASLDTLNHMYEVERLLFNAHEHEENLCAALERLGGVIGAEKVGFCVLEQPGEPQWHRWEKGSPARECKVPGSRELAAKLLDIFAAGSGAYESSDESELREIFPAEVLPGMRSVMAVPVESVGGQVSGILVACNMKGGPEQAALLKNVQFSFGMFCSNLKTYRKIRDRGYRDALTGLYNRNRYERDLPKIFARHSASLACVYVDANGLREMNNTEGHDRGDEMLRAVAEELPRHFDTPYIYRTGGDEFVLFLPGAGEADLKRRREELAASLAGAGYYISMGIACGRDVPSISHLLHQAEQAMYAEKRAYYAQRGLRRG